jgi:23S rRNA (adenine2503-C2)-methyltransferase
LEACKRYIQATNRRVTFEYALIDNINDSEKDAYELADLLKGMLCHVNLIPINPIEGGRYKKSTINKLESFREILNNKGITCTRRRELGNDIEAACGQLRRKYIGG